MSNKIFLDSSILVEYRKGVQTDLLEAIVTNIDFEPLINQVVVSEYLFYHLAIFSGKSPMSVKSAADIQKYLSVGDPEGFLSQFGWLNDFPLLYKKAINFMETYNLLPNDALILSLCKFHGIKYLASFDTDYTIACQIEGILLISTKTDFDAISK
jgi:uncharacterized protein